VAWFRVAFNRHVRAEAASGLYLRVFSSVAAVLGTAHFVRAGPHFADLL
jgi:hypothetical protein